jgi:hypothetical protein
MTTIDPTLCHSCSRLRDAGTCTAFPDGIPTEIIHDGADHREAWPGDNGVRYRLRRGGERMFEAWLTYGRRRG